MSINEIVKLVPPPANPLDQGTEADRRRIEERLGRRLPSEVFELGNLYGSGRFYSTLTIYNPFAPRYFDLICNIININQNLRQKLGKDEYPFDLYPSKLGLFPCGDENNGGSIFWFTEGDPDHWPLVLMTEDFQSERRDTPVSTFLADLLSGRRDCLLFDSDWISHALLHTDEPFKQEVQFR